MLFLVKVVELVGRGGTRGIASGIGGEFSGKTCITLLARPISWCVLDKRGAMASRASQASKELTSKQHGAVWYAVNFIIILVPPMTGII